MTNTRHPDPEVPQAGRSGRVVHCRNAPQRSFVYIGRPSIFGNPFRLRNPKDDQERAVVLDRFRQYFLERITTDTTFRAQVETLRGQDLGCWCAPRTCHGEVILAWLRDHPPADGNSIP